ncbi:MAG TPA: hypothetical protein VM261_27065 [Kofleriaceae bacterium]|nr:hypothetical protein [Kofleriaceae bacterium]
MSLLILSSVITAGLAQGPTTAETVVNRSMLRFEAVELRRSGSDGTTAHRLAVFMEDGVWTGPTYEVYAHDGHTCHDDAARVAKTRLDNLALPSGRRAAVAQIDVDYTMSMTCAPDDLGPRDRSLWKAVVVERWTERAFLVCAADDTNKKVVCLPPIVTRARAGCKKKATLGGDTLVAPCEAGTIGTGGQWLDLGKGRHTIDL